MDAIFMREDAEVSFKSTNDWAHMGGHDGHMAMLVATAELLVNRAS